MFWKHLHGVVWLLSRLIRYKGPGPFGVGFRALRARPERRLCWPLRENCGASSEQVKKKVLFFVIRCGSHSPVHGRWTAPQSAETWFFFQTFCRRKKKKVFYLEERYLFFIDDKRKWLMIAEEVLDCILIVSCFILKWHYLCIYLNLKG